MASDEEQIRALVQTWMEATQRGEMDRVLELMTEDVVFLVPGKPPMRKAAFEQAARAQAAPGGPRFEGKSEIQELKVLGDWAFMWTKLAVKTLGPSGAVAASRSGHTLTILRKEGGRWKLARDANLLAPDSA